MYRQSPTTSHLLLSAVSGVIRAHEKATGKRAWEVSISELPYHSMVRLVVDGPYVVGFGAQNRPKPGFFAGNEVHGSLFMLDYETGRVNWSVRVPGPIFSPTLLVEAPHIFVANGTMLSAFAFEDGRVLWSDNAVGEVWTSRGTQFTHPVALATPAGSAQGGGF